MPRPRTNHERDLRIRVTELEARVRWLEGRLKKVSAAAKVKGAAPTASRKRRCPGCLAELSARRRDKNCVYCGFSFEAVRPLKPARRR